MKVVRLGLTGWNKVVLGFFVVLAIFIGERYFSLAMGTLVKLDVPWIRALTGYLIFPVQWWSCRCFKSHCNCVPFFNPLGHYCSKTWSSSYWNHLCNRWLRFPEYSRRIPLLSIAIGSLHSVHHLFCFERVELASLQQVLQLIKHCCDHVTQWFDHCISYF